VCISITGNRSSTDNIPYSITALSIVSDILAPANPRGNNPASFISGIIPILSRAVSALAYYVTARGSSLSCFSVSIMSTVLPASARRRAVAGPTGPVPTIRTFCWGSYSSGEVWISSIGGEAMLLWVFGLGLDCIRGLG
jgi:hypothetical protein